MAVVINGDTGISPVTASGTSASVDGMTVGRGGGEVSTNTAVGASALTTNSSGANNSAFGQIALQANTSGSQNIAIGVNSLNANTTGSENSGVGVSALAFNTTGANNTAVGRQALNQNTTASNNTAVGYQAAYSNTTGANNVVVGKQSLYTNSTGGGLTAIGNQVLQGNTASDNTAMGYNTMNNNTTGTMNTAIGGGQFGVLGGALSSNSTGSYNTALGHLSLYSNTTASQNTAVGYQSGYTQTTAGGGFNTLLGFQAGYTSNTYQLTLVGGQAGYNTTGPNNTFIGANSGDQITSGRNNSILGRYNGNQNSLDIRTSNNYIVLSDGDGNPRGYYNGPSGFWAFSNGTASSTVGNFYTDSTNPYGLYVSFNAASPNNTSNYVFGANDSSGQVYRIWSNGTTSGRSDSRLKKNIAPANSQLSDVMAMEVVNYEWNQSIEGTKEIGWIAQQVQQIKPNLVQENDDGYLHLKREPMVAILWKAVQELKTIVDAQAAEIAELKAKVV